MQAAYRRPGGTVPEEIQQSFGICGNRYECNGCHRVLIAIFLNKLDEEGFVSMAPNVLREVSLPNISEAAFQDQEIWSVASLTNLLKEAVLLLKQVTPMFHCIMGESDNSLYIDDNTLSFSETGPRIRALSRSSNAADHYLQG